MTAVPKIIRMHGPEGYSALVVPNAITKAKSASCKKEAVASAMRCTGSVRVLAIGALHYGVAVFSCTVVHPLSPDCLEYFSTVSCTDASRSRMSGHPGN